MVRDQAITLLRAHQADLARLGVGSLYLYGSVARNQARDDSDVDLLVDPARDDFSLFDLMRVADTCSELLGRQAELHDYRALSRKPAFRDAVAGDLINVF